MVVFSEKELLKKIHTENLCILVVTFFFLQVYLTYGVALFISSYDGLFSRAGFSSMYLYKRFYRCNTSLDGFAFDDGNVERRREISLDEFSKDYDAKKPV